MNDFNEASLIRTHPQSDINRENKMIALLADHDIKTAAIKAGYSESYIRNPDFYKKINSEAFQRKIIAWYRNTSLKVLPKLQMVEEKVIDHLIDQPLEISKYERTIKRIQQATGVLQPDFVGHQTTINVSDNRQLMINHIKQSNQFEVSDVELEMMGEDIEIKQIDPPK